MVARSFVSGEEPSGAHLISLPPPNRTDSVIKSSLGVIKKGERWREGELLPPQVRPGTFAANHNQGMDAHQHDKRRWLHPQEVGLSFTPSQN